MTREGRVEQFDRGLANRPESAFCSRRVTIRLTGEDAPEPSSSRARRLMAFVGSCRSLAHFGCRRCAKRELAEQTIPVERVVSPTRSSEDVAGPAVFLASD